MNPIGRITGMIVLAITAAAYVAGCSDNPEAPPPNELEEIRPNVVILKLVNATNSADSVSASFRDADGDGGANPTIDTLNVTAGTTYSGTLRSFFAGRINNRDTVIDFAPEYIELGRYHQFFYTPGGAGANRLSVTITDKDSTNLPIGLSTTIAVAAGAATNATLRVELGHFDDEAQPKDGTRLPYEHDIDFLFAVTIR